MSVEVSTLLYEHENILTGQSCFGDSVLLGEEERLANPGDHTKVGEESGDSFDAKKVNVPEGCA